MAVSEHARVFRGRLTQLLLEWDNSTGKMSDAIPNESFLTRNLAVYSPLPEYPGIPAETWDDFVRRQIDTKYTFSADSPYFLAHLRRKLSRG